MIVLVLGGSALQIGFHYEVGKWILLFGSWIGIYLAIEIIKQIFKEITSGLPQR